MSDERAPSSTSATRELLGGSARVFLAEALILPTALVTAGFLTRRLGPSDFGVFTLATAIVAWVEWTLFALFARASVRLVADAEDWRPAGSVVLRVFALAGAIGLALLWAASAPLAALMHEPSLARYLRLLALDIPLFTLSQAHLQILVGTGAYASRATVALWRWTSRMVLVVALVAMGLSIDGAILGMLGASVVELIVARRLVKPPLRGGDAATLKALWKVAVPLFLAAMAMRLFDKLDLFTLKALGASAAVAGQYGAAQNLTIIPALVSLSLTTLLISTLTRSLRAGDEAGARDLARNALRGTILLFPFAGLSAGAATGIATLIFGPEFSPSGPLLALLIFGSVAVVMISVISAMLVARGKATWTMALAIPIPLVALAGHLAIIPRFGAEGAATVTMRVAIAAAAVALIPMHRAWRIAPPLGTSLRSAAVTLLALWGAVRWETSGIAVVLELAAGSILIALALAALGELTPAERARLASVLRRDRLPRGVPAEHP